MATVYKILSPDLMECYVGSTTMSVEKRWWYHKSKGNQTTSRILIGQYGEDCKIVVLEVCPLEERLEKEQWWLDHSAGAVNKNKAFVSQEERLAYNKAYYEAHRAEEQERQKVYHETHREEILAYNKTYYEGNHEKLLAQKRDYYVENREAILSQVKEYGEAHREDKLAYNKAYYKATRDAILAQKRAYYQAKKAKNHAEPSAAQ